MTRGLIAAYKEIDSLIDAIEALKQRKFQRFTVYTPTPRHEIEHALHPPTSKVRLFTLIGGLCGVTFGYWIAIWTSDYWPLVVGGKAVASWIPYTIIGFEVMVLVRRAQHGVRHVHPLADPEDHADDRVRLAVHGRPLRHLRGDGARAPEGSGSGAA
jgi:hypothetical protein